MQNDMRFFMILKKYLQQSIPFLPRRRRFKQSLAWLNKIRPKILSSTNLSGVKQEFDLTDKQTKYFKKNELREILDIITYSEFDKTYDPETILDFYFAGDFAPNDSIHQPIIRKTIKKGLSLMQLSKDPAHGFTHVIRVARLAKLMYQNLKAKHPNLDWGIIATATAWHDIYRVDHLGFLYSKNTLFRKLLRQIDILQDIIIYSLNKQDSFGSVYIFLKQTRKKLPKHLRAQIAIAILGGHTLDSLKEKIYPGIKIFKKITEAADMIDIMTIGRWEEMHRKIRYRGQADTAFINRSIILNALFNIKHLLKYIRIRYARQIYKLTYQAAEKHGRKFYPDDAKLFKISAG